MGMRANGIRPSRPRWPIYSRRSAAAGNEGAHKCSRQAAGGFSSVCAGGLGIGMLMSISLWITPRLSCWRPVGSLRAIPLPAITHVDGSARVQTVSRETHPRFADLLEHFYSRTGCPVLLNTSFNMRGEPIVCSTMDAIACFGHSKMETLVIEDFVIDRSDIPPAWKQLPQRRSVAEHEYLVYAML